MNAPFAPMELHDADLQRLTRFVHEHYGINLTEDKRELVKTRLAKRVHALGLASYHEYIEHVLSAAGEDERSDMADALSTNVTQFFRESAHMDFLRDRLLPQLLAQDRRGDPEIRAWCAASSSGEEPYTMAIVMDGVLRERGDQPWKILATDISTRMLAAAKAGIYPQDRLQGVPAAELRRHFQKGSGGQEGLYKVKPGLRGRVSFGYLNLIGQYPFRKRFDFIFCRNVMIYFDAPTREAVVGRMERFLKPGGHLFLGMSESLTSIRHDFAYVQPSVYRRSG